LIKRLAKIKEELGKIDEAADLMQEVAVSLHALEFRINGSYTKHDVLNFLVLFSKYLQ
jgi:hypothetical protein